MRPKYTRLLMVSEKGLGTGDGLKLGSRAAYMQCVKMCGGTLFDEASFPIVVGQGRKRFNMCLEDDTVQERENK